MDHKMFMLTVIFVFTSNLRVNANLIMGGTQFDSESRVCVYKSDTERGYFTWEEARTFCKSHDGHLAIVDTKEKQDIIRRNLGGTELCDGSFNCHIWLAGRLTVESEWRWISPTDQQFRTLDKSTDINNYCGTLTYVGLFKTALCIYDYRPLCRYYKDQNAQRCKGTVGVLVRQLEGSCVVLHQNNVTSWDRARNLCIANGGDLFVPDSYHEVIRVMDGLARDNGTAWIGLQRWMWTWETNIVEERSSVTYSSWVSHAGVTKDRDCMYTDLVDYAKWYDKPCGGDGLAMCQIKTHRCPGGTTSTSTTSTSTTTTASTTTATTKTTRPRELASSPTTIATSGARPRLPDGGQHTESPAQSPVPTTASPSSTPSTTTTTNASLPSAGQSGEDKGDKDKYIIIGVIVPLTCILLILVIVLLVKLRRRRKGASYSGPPRYTPPDPDHIYENNVTTRNELPDVGPLDSHGTNIYSETIPQMTSGDDLPAYHEPGSLLQSKDPLYAEPEAVINPGVQPVAVISPTVRPGNPYASIKSDRVLYSTTLNNDPVKGKKKDKSKKIKPPNSTVSHTFAPGTHDLYAVPDKPSTQRYKPTTYVTSPPSDGSVKGGLDKL